MAGFGRIHVLSVAEAELRRKLQEMRSEAHVALYLVNEYVPDEPHAEANSDLTLREALRARLESIDAIILELTGG